MTVPKYDYFLSHGSIYGILACNIRGRKAITITDNDFYNKTNKIIYGKSTYMILPEYVKYQQFDTNHVITFNGFKEDIYIANFDPKNCVKEIPLDEYVLIRPEAYKAYYLKEEIKKLNDKGVIHSIRTIKDLDEAPSAYKDISVVMKNQKDLVDILVELTPLAVIKG